eukprot:TRINITY_DN4853_c0_g1_i1.p1 TRINITY_DN4853_c0_g1~~TRINITY_DN4853_c0_g1_i1.p1  ORF type:complete len:385 (+),score=50.52 TRINITY_DN4853_c0_g1_i1:74-1228(+)
MDFELEDSGEENFPRNIKIEDIREAISGRDDFREVRGPDFSVFIYFLGMAKDIFPNPDDAPDERTAYLWKLRRECRGIVFNDKGEVISRRFHKFFNINETEETKGEKIDLSKPFLLTEKLDGTMISPFYSEGVLRFGTKAGLTDSTLLVEEFISKSTVPYREFSTYCVSKGWTPLYEYCGPKHPIVLTYKEELLRLLALRNIVTGNYITFSQLRKISEQTGIPLTKAWTPSELGLNDLSSFATFEQSIKNQNGLEGFVIRFDSGLMFKIKTNWYFSLNKTLDKIKNRSERHLWKSILNEEYDDIKTFLSDDMRVRMDEFAVELNNRIQIAMHSSINKVKDYKDLPGKEFSSWVNTCPGHERYVSIVFGSTSRPPHGEIENYFGK